MLLLMSTAYCVAASRCRLVSVSLQGFEPVDPCLAYLIHTILMGEVSRRIDFYCRPMGGALYPLEV